MSIYWIACLLSTCFANYFKKFKKNIKKTPFFLSFITSLPLLLISALRYGIGTDYFSYIMLFNVYYKNGQRGSIEPLFYLLNRIFFMLRLNAECVISVCAIITICLVFYYIYKESIDIPMSVFLFFGMNFYFASFNGVRQLLACSILLISIIALQENRFKTFLILVLIATGFHYTSIIFLVVILFVKIEITPKRVLFLSCVFLFLLYFFNDIIINLISLTNYEKYLISDGEGFSIQAILGLIIQITILCFCSYCYVDEKKYRFYYGIQMLSVWCLLLGTYISYADRIKWIFSIPSIVLIPLAVENFKRLENRRIVKIIIVILFIIYVQIIVGLMGSHGVIPYRSLIEFL